MTDIETVRAAIQSQLFSHSRQRRWCGADVTYIYHRDPKSPTGVKLACGCDPAIADPLLRELRNASSLSPEEF